MNGTSAVKAVVSSKCEAGYLKKGRKKNNSTGGVGRGDFFNGHVAL